MSDNSVRSRAGASGPADDAANALASALTPPHTPLADEVDGQGRRLFRMAPLHHHYELGGLKEQQVVLRFWAASLALVILGLILLP